MKFKKKALFKTLKSFFNMFINIFNCLFATTKLIPLSEKRCLFSLLRKKNYGFIVFNTAGVNKMETTSKCKALDAMQIKKHKMDFSNFVTAQL